MFHEHYHNLLPVLKDPLSVIESAREKCLPPVLHIANIALLMHPHDKKLQEVSLIMLEAAIRDNDLKVISVEEFSYLTMEYEKSRDSKKYEKPKPPRHLTPITAIAVAHQSSDLLPANECESPEQAKIFVVHRDEMKKWLQKENEWPLDKDNLLSRWWPESTRKIKGSQHQGANELKEENFFRLEKDYWQVRFQGKRWSIRQSVGIRYIICLIERAYNDEPEIHVSELYYLVHGRPISKNTELNRLSKKKLSEIGLDVSGLAEGLDVMTPDGIEWCREQRRQLDEQMEEAEKIGQIMEVQDLRDKKEALEDYVKKALGLSRRVRKASDENERTRKSVSKAIESALVRMGKNEGDELATYIDDHLVKGLFCSFRKDQNNFWKIIKNNLRHKK